VWGEDIIFDNFPSVKNKSIASGNETPNLSLTEGEPTLDKYILTLSRCRGRKLTQKRDAVNAFTGVLHQLCIRPKSSHLCGLPTIIFDLSLLFWHIGRATRRRGFPSWSWAGWSGYLWAYIPEGDQQSTNE
jgi:hypothetical protein